MAIVVTHATPSPGADSGDGKLSENAWEEAHTVVPLAHDYATVATDQSTASGSYGDLATAGPAVTLTVNTKVKVTLSAMLYNAGGGGGSMAVAISGANTVAAAQASSLVIYSADGLEASRTLYFSGLTPGSTTFTAKYADVAGGTAHFLAREILVECMD